MSKLVFLRFLTFVRHDTIKCSRAGSLTCESHLTSKVEVSTNKKSNRVSMQMTTAKWKELSPGWDRRETGLTGKL